MSYKLDRTIFVDVYHSARSNKKTVSVTRAQLIKVLVPSNSNMSSVSIIRGSAFPTSVIRKMMSRDEVSLFYSGLFHQTIEVTARHQTELCRDL